MSDTFWIYRSADAGATWQRIAIVPRDGSGNYSYMDGGLQPGTTYHYKVQAWSGYAEYSTYSDTASDTTAGVVPVDMIGPIRARLVVDQELPIDPFQYPIIYSEDWTNMIIYCRASTNSHGFEALEVGLEMTAGMATHWYSRGVGFMRLYTTDGRVSWVGQMRDMILSRKGLDVVAYGPWIGLTDYLVTQAYSLTSYKNMYTLSSVSWGGTRFPDPSNWQLDLSDRMQVAPNKGTTANAHQIDIAIRIPYLSYRYFKRVIFDYEMKTATNVGGNYLEATLNDPVLDEDGKWISAITTLWTLSGNGATQTGSVSLTPATANHMYFEVTTPGAGTYSYDADAEHFKITDFRLIAGEYSGTDHVYADQIVKDILDRFSAVAGGQSFIFLDQYSGIQSPGTDIENAIYEDKPVSDIFDLLARRANYEVAIWEDRKVKFHPEGEYALEWQADVQDPSLEFSLNDIYTIVHALFVSKYDDGAMRTVPLYDLASRHKYNLYRESAVTSQARTNTGAETYRDATAEIVGRSRARAKMDLVTPKSLDGVLASPFDVRANDYISFEINFGTLVELERGRFLIGHTEIDLMTGELKIEPIIPPPSIAAQLAAA